MINAGGKKFPQRKGGSAEAVNAVPGAHDGRNVNARNIEGDTIKTWSLKTATDAILTACQRMTMSHDRAGRRHHHGSRHLAVGLVTVLAASISLIAANIVPALAQNINYPAQEVNDNSNLCMGIAGGSSANGAAVVQFRCETHPDQAWNLPWQPGTGLDDLGGSTGLVINRSNSNRCLGTLNGGTGNSTKVVSKACSTVNRDEVWTTVSAGEYGYAGGWELKNDKTGDEKCLGVPGGSVDGSVQLVIYDCNGHPDQVWWRGAEFPNL